MSHINDLIGVMRGLRLVAEAGLKIQQENCNVVWNNSSIKNLMQTCTSNPITNFKPQPIHPKDLIERAMVVAQGFRQYALMQVPNFDPASQQMSSTMDPNLSKEIEELNQEFNKTFETLKKTQNQILNTVPPLPPNLVVPLETVGLNEQKKKQDIEPSVPVVAAVAAVSAAPVKTGVKPLPVAAATTAPRPIAKKKIRVAILDATFDDLLPLAREHMPASWSLLVKEVVRSHVDLNIAELMSNYNGPVQLIRRTEDEIICLRPGVMATNCGNNLLLKLLKSRNPELFVHYPESASEHVLRFINMPQSERDKLLRTRIASENHNLLSLISRYFRDYRSTHCTPLPSDLFAEVASAFALTIRVI